MHLILIAGLPGSGKTTLAKKLAVNLARSIHLEDPSEDSIQAALTKIDINYIIMDTPHFCIEDNRKDFMEMLTGSNPNTTIKISWICFSNDAPLVKFNILERESGEQLYKIGIDIDIFENNYTFPQNSLILNVYPEKYNVATILKYLHE